MAATRGGEDGLLKFKDNQTTVPEREYACYMDEKMSPEPPKTLKWVESR